MIAKSVLFLFAVFSSVNAFSADDYYHVSALEIREVVPTPAELYSDFLVPSHTEPHIQAVDWGSVVLIGEKVIELIKAGKPVVDLKRDAVSVVPDGIGGWDKLSGWKAPNTKVYAVTAKNYLNLTVIDLRLKVSAMHGGGINGRGKYLANVIVVPTSIYVRWGFSCDVWTEHRQPVNMGSKSEPVAGLGFDIRFRYGSALNEQVGAQDFFVTGLGEIKALD